MPPQPHGVEAAAAPTGPMHGSRHGHTALDQPTKPARSATGNERRLLIVLVLTAGYMAAEVAGGLLANSLALLADAGHMLADVLGLAMALFALRFARRPATPAKTYGFYRAEILATLVNSLVLFGITGYILYEAWRRFQEPPAVSSLPMLVVALGGLLVNLVGVRLLHAGAGQSLSVHGAFLEVLGDLLGSLGTILAAAVIYVTGWWPADPLISVLLGLFIVARTWRLLKSALDVLLEATPEHLKVEHIEAAMRDVPGVASVHDLHVWTISSGFVAMSGHVAARGRSSSDVLHDLQALLRERFGVEHTTLQVEHCEHADDVACCTLDPHCLIIDGASSVIRR